MLFLAPIALAGGMAAAAPKSVDFQLDGAAPAPTISAPVIPTGPATPPVRSSPARPYISTARGFGKGTPLSFAVRQIVPHHVHVTYGDGIDPQQVVNWSGGQPWTQALRGAIRPLGWHLVFRPAVVEIVK